MQTVRSRSRWSSSWSIAALLACAAPTLSAQGLLAPDDPRHAEILSVVTRLFDGMRSSDSAMVRTLFHPSAQLFTTVGAHGKPAVRLDSLATFLRSIGTVRQEKLDERIKNSRVLLDGTLAVVWTDYDLYVGTRFIHCGVDAFQLAKTGEAWQIVSLADTRRQDGCTPAPDH